MHGCEATLLAVLWGGDHLAIYVCTAPSTTGPLRTTVLGLFILETMLSGGGAGRRHRIVGE